MNSHYCILPFIHLHINEEDQVKLCCYSNTLTPYTSEFDYLNNEALQQVRNQLRQGLPVKQCESCYKIERDGGESFRMRDTAEWKEKLKIQDLDAFEPQLIYYDIRNDHTCNLSCRICHPGASSQLEKEYKKLNWPIRSASRKHKLTEIVDLDTIQQLQIAGGEPTIMPEFKQFLENAIAQNRTDVGLKIITNATNVNLEYQNLLSKFPDKEFTVSIDGYDLVNRYIRWPSNWNTLVTNIHRIYEITDQVSFNVTVSMWNVSNLSELVLFLEKEFDRPLIFLNEAVPIRQANITPFNRPDHEVVVADLEKLKTCVSYQTEDHFKNKVDYFLSKMKTCIIDINALRKFFNYNDQLDQSRNTNLENFVPELHACKSYL